MSPPVPPAGTAGQTGRATGPDDEEAAAAAATPEGPAASASPQLVQEGQSYDVGEERDLTVDEGAVTENHESQIGPPGRNNGDDASGAGAPRTRQPAPGPDAFVRWYLGHDDSCGCAGCQRGPTGSGRERSAGRDDRRAAENGVDALGADPSSSGNGAESPSGMAHCEDPEVGQNVRSRVSRAEAEWAVRNFMGPRTNSLQREILQLRRRRPRCGGQPSPSPPPTWPASGNQQPRQDVAPEGNDEEGKDESHYASVSYQLVDTPVWHNFAASLKDAPPRTSSKPPPPPPALGLITRVRRMISGEAERKAVLRVVRNHRGWLGRDNRPVRRPNDDDNSVDDPVRSYIRDTRFLTRIMITTIGFLASVVGFAVSTSSNLLLDVKNRWVLSIFDRAGIASGFAAFLLLNLVLGIAAHLPVAHRPVSAGSGIAEAKAVLNGIILPSCTEVRSAACKAVSVVFSGAASLPVGLEGPLIFSGLSIGSNINRLLLMSGSERSGKPSRPTTTYPTLQTHRAQRDLAACGTAAGVTTAFFTPLGGVMFAMEEGCSFWSVQLAWQTFASSCTTVIFSYLWVLAFVQHKLGEPFQILSLGKFTGLPKDNSSGEMTPAPLRFWFYALFAAMGIAAGILGSVWCETSRRLSIWRAQREMGRLLKLLEVLVLVALSSSLTWWLPQLYMECSPLDATVAADTYFRSFGCPEGQYNQLATLLLNPPGEVSLNLLFWEGPDSFSTATCLLAATIYLVILLLIFGSSISMGIFIPLLFVGACFGRALGVAMEVGAGTTTFAIVGSVAMLAGVTRILVSVTVIMMTATNTPYLVSCFMVTSLFARVTGKWMFGRDGIYDIILELKKIPFLESTSPTNVMFRGLQARDLIKSQPFITLKPEQKVGSLFEVLEANPCLPDFVVVDDDEGALLGVMSREDIRVLLDHAELFYTHGESRREPTALSYEYLMQCRRRNTPESEFIHLQSVRANLTEEQLGQFLDLTPYISIAHYQFDIHGSCERAYELFRTLGLRTLVVTSANGVPRGVLCRYDLKQLEEVNVDHRQKHLRQTDRNAIFSFKSITSS